MGNNGIYALVMQTQHNYKADVTGIKGADLLLQILSTVSTAKQLQAHKGSAMPE